MTLSLVFLLLFFSIPTIAQSFTGRDVEVKDRDTIVVLPDGVNDEAHVFGVDCPEGRQPHCKWATAFAKNLVEGKTVLIHLWC